MQKKTDQVEARVADLEAATVRGGGPLGSRLPKATQEVVAGYLEDGRSISDTARRLGLSRDQVRTVKYAMHGLTLAEARRLKQRSKP